MRIYNKKVMEGRRRELRNNSTLAEIILWKHLKQKQLKNRKFRRQQSIENYIVDFYCPEERLVIELDGKHHFEVENINYDEERTKYLNGLNIKVMRFENIEVLNNLENVLRKIAAEFKSDKNLKNPLLK